MKTLRTCQCGGKPAIVEVPGPKPIRPRMQRMRDGVRERAECPMCGNATGVHSKRAKLRREWNTAAWCGQVEVRDPEPRSEGLSDLAARAMRNTYLLDDLMPDVALMFPKVPVVTPVTPHLFIRSRCSESEWSRQLEAIRAIPQSAHVVCDVAELTDADVERMIRDLDQAFFKASVQPRVFQMEGGAQ